MRHFITKDPINPERARFYLGHQGKLTVIDGQFYTITQVVYCQRLSMYFTPGVRGATGGAIGLHLFWRIADEVLPQVQETEATIST